MKLPENWDLKIDPDVFKVLKKIPRYNAEAILKVVGLLPLDIYFGDIQKIKGEQDVWRRRIGSYRIFYKIKMAEKVILIFHIERRNSKTY